MSLHLPTTARSPEFYDDLVKSAALPALIDRAAAALTNARSSAEILEAREIAGTAYDAAKKAARLSKAKGAHDALIAAAHRAQADALDIEAGAKRRLADEYDAAQERGEARSRGGDRISKLPDGKFGPSDVGLNDKQLHEARIIRDAEASEPGIVRRALNERLERGEEPTRAALREAVTDAALRGLRGHKGPSRRNPLYVPPSEERAAWTHVYGTARAFVEWATDSNIKLALAGLNERDDSQASNIRAVRDCVAIFNTIAEHIDAQ